MGTYLHNGHKVDLFPSVLGYYAYLDDDLEPLDVSEAEVVDIITNGTRIN